jgi:hypothetical protein
MSNYQFRKLEILGAGTANNTFALKKGLVLDNSQNTDADFIQLKTKGTDDLRVVNGVGVTIDFQKFMMINIDNSYYYIPLIQQANGTTVKLTDVAVNQKSPWNISSIDNNLQIYQSSTIIPPAGTIPNLIINGTNNYVGIRTTNPTYPFFVGDNSYFQNNVTINGSLNVGNMSLNAANMDTITVHNVLTNTLTADSALFTSLTALSVTGVTLLSNDLTSLNITSDTILANNVLSNEGTIGNVISTNITSSNIIGVSETLTTSLNVSNVLSITSGGLLLGTTGSVINLGNVIFIKQV